MARNFFTETRATREGIEDVWNAFMVEGAIMLDEDIPLCPTTATSLPHEIITWVEAKRIYHREVRKGNKCFRHNAFVCWYIDDSKFDSSCGIWCRPHQAMKILSHFAGVITPDFSISQDFPKPWKLFNIYRMRAFGYWCGVSGLKVINNVRWGTHETWGYCFTGIQRHSVVSIGTVASGLRMLENRPLFEEGLAAMMRTLEPHTIVVYGSAKYECFRELEGRGVRVVEYPSAAARRFSKAGGRHEQN